MRQSYGSILQPIICFISSQIGTFPLGAWVSVRRWQNISFFVRHTRETDDRCHSWNFLILCHTIMQSFADAHADGEEADFDKLLFLSTAQASTRSNQTSSAHCHAPFLIFLKKDIFLYNLIMVSPFCNTFGKHNFPVLYPGPKVQNLIGLRGIILTMFPHQVSSMEHFNLLKISHRAACV